MDAFPGSTGACPSPVHVPSSADVLVKSNNILQVLLTPQILADVRLVVCDDGSRVEFSALQSISRTRTESQRHVGHVEEDDAIVALRVLRYLAHARLVHVIAVQE